MTRQAAKSTELLGMYIGFEVEPNDELRQFLDDLDPDAGDIDSKGGIAVIGTCSPRYGMSMLARVGRRHK